MKTKLLSLASVVVVLSMLGCAPSVSVTMLQDITVAEHSGGEPVKVYYSKAPECPYEELAILNVGRGELDMFGKGDSKFVDALRSKAGDIGGDALILGPALSSISSMSQDAAGNVNVHKSKTQEGVVIRFKSRDCVD